MTYQWADGVLFRRTGESMLVFVRDGRRLLKVSGSAVALWDALKVPRSLHGTATLLAETFAMDADLVRAEIADVLADLAVHRAVTCSDPAP